MLLCFALVRTHVIHYTSLLYLGLAIRVLNMQAVNQAVNPNPNPQFEFARMEQWNTYRTPPKP